MIVRSAIQDGLSFASMVPDFRAKPMSEYNKLVCAQFTKMFHAHLDDNEADRNRVDAHFRTSNAIQKAFKDHVFGHLRNRWKLQEAPMSVSEMMEVEKRHRRNERRQQVLL